MADPQLEDLLLYTAIGVFASIAGFFLLSLHALGPAFIPLITGSDSYVIGIGVGESMEPVIKEGDLLIVDPTPDQIDKMDIIVYDCIKCKPEKLIGHRVVRITSIGYIVKGDNVPRADPWLVKRDQVVGKVIHVVRDWPSKQIVYFWIENQAQKF